MAHPCCPVPSPCPRSADPALAAELGEPLQAALGFFSAARDAYGPLMVAALSRQPGGAGLRLQREAYEAALAWGCRPEGRHTPG